MTDDVLIIDDDDRYGRLRLISWWRQEKLRDAKVLVVGAGALGNEVLKNLALLGVGQVAVVDLDTIEASNLTRSILFRSGDAGASKAKRAVESVKEINPDVRVLAIHGNVITDVGLGLFAAMDVVIGCLDNREARLWINRQCWKAGKPWVDGAIQEISGTVKVFVPPASACYECGMSEGDYRHINLKYSCPLLKREDVAEGKVPTAPTISSMIAGLQTQEALKLIHGMPVKAGAVMVFNGESNSFYTTQIQRKDQCLSHETWASPKDLAIGADDAAEELFRLTGAAALQLSRELLVSVSCPACGISREVFRPLSSVRHKDGVCDKCGAVMKTETTHRIEASSPLAKRKLSELGVAPYDDLIAETGRDATLVRLAADRERILAWR